MTDNIDRKEKNQSYRRFGYCKFGPFLYAYTKWLYDDVKNNNIHKVFFLARDGYMMKRAFDVFVDKNKDNIKTYYFYCSRRSLRNGLLYDSKNYEDSLKYLTFRKVNTIDIVLEYYGFDASERLEIADKYHIDLNRTIRYGALKTDQDLIKLFNRFSKKISERSGEQYRILSRYLSENQFSGRIALVDIGWHGSMQYYLEQLCHKSSVEVDITGYYIGNISFSGVEGERKGFLFDDNHPLRRSEVMCFFGVLEKLFQSREGSTTGYIEVDGRIKPVLDQYEYKNDPKIISSVCALQKASLRFVNNQIINPVHEFNVEEYVKPLLSFGKYPSLGDVSLFSFFYNIDGHKEFFTAQKGFFQYSLHELIHAFQFSAWKTGFMKSLFKIPFPYYLVYKVLS